MDKSVTGERAGAEVIEFPGQAKSKFAVVLSLSRGPAIVVDVVREVTPAGVELFHVERYSRFGGPRALVAKDLTSSNYACQMARAELR